MAGGVCTVSCGGQSPHRGQGGPVSHSAGLLGVPAGLTTRNAGLRQTLPSQRYFLTCWGLEKKTQASDFVQEVQPSLSSGRCSPPPPWTRPSTSFGSCVSAQLVSLRSLAWVHTPWEGLESVAALAAQRPQVGNEQDPGFIREWPGPLASPCWMARPFRPTLGPGHWWGAGQGRRDGCCPPMCQAICGSQEEEPNSPIHREGSQQ